MIILLEIIIQPCLYIYRVLGEAAKSQEETADTSSAAERAGTGVLQEYRSLILGKMVYYLPL